MAKITIQRNRGGALIFSSRIIKTILLCLLAYGIGSYSREKDFLTISNDSLSLFSTISTTNTEAASSSKLPSTVKHEQETTQRLANKEPTPDTTSEATSTLLNFIPNNQLNLHDYFSDSFLLNKANFLKVPISEIGIVEDACFAAIGKRRVHYHSKMFVDWTEFMVMHLSKWWNELGILNDSDPIMFNHTIHILGNYLEKVAAFSNNAEQSPLHPTIAAISFAPYHSRQDEKRGEQLIAHSLAATIASLYHVGFGRVVVTGYNDQDETRVHEAFRLLHKLIATKDAGQSVPAKIGNTELAYVKITDESWLKTHWVKFNMPRAAVIGMQHALGGKLTEEQDSQAWLGSTHDASFWKYVYLTEPDTLLHTKPSLWKSIQHGLDSGLSFFPHRLQPLPHQYNLPPSESDATNKKHVSNIYAGKFIPNIHPFSNITTLDDSLHCCDDGPKWPGRSEEFGTQQRPCRGSWWWGCGYSKDYKVLDLTKEQVLEYHKRIVPYPMMTIKRGTGIVFGPTEMGRRCLPSKTPCPKGGATNTS